MKQQQGGQPVQFLVASPLSPNEWVLYNAPKEGVRMPIRLFSFFHNLL
jgi:hypothetical protein